MFAVFCNYLAHLNYISEDIFCIAQVMVQLMTDCSCKRDTFIIEEL